MSSSLCNHSAPLTQQVSEHSQAVISNLSQANVDQEYTVKKVVPVDQEVVDFLFSLGCFEGETITLMSIISDSYVVSINGARYSLSSELAELILI